MPNQSPKSGSKAKEGPRPTAVAEHTVRPDEPARRRVSEDEQTTLLQLPVYSQDAIRSFVKRHEGFERAVPRALKRLQNYPNMTATLKLDLPQLDADFAAVCTLIEQEDIVFRLYRRAFENRLAKESTLMRAMLKLNRFLQNSDDAELVRDFAELSSWITARTGGGRTREPGEEEPEPAPPAPAADPDKPE